MAIIVSKNGHEAHKVERSTFDKEDDLQRYLRDNPEALPIDQIRDGASLVVLAREYTTESGPIDILAADDQGRLFIIETKLYRNPDKRKVVAQVLDYGAALWRHSSDFSEFRADLSEQVQRQCGMSLEDQIAARFSTDETGTEAVFSAMKECLEHGKFAFMVLMDQVDDRLRDLISYVNTNSNFQVYAVELEYYQHDSYEILMPHVYGAEVKTPDNEFKGPAPEWTEERFFDRLSDADPNTANVAHRLLAWLKEHADNVLWRGGRSMGSFVPQVYRNGILTSLSAVYTYGKVELYFEYLTDKAPFLETEKREELRHRAETLLGKPVTDDMLAKRPNIPLVDFSKPEDFARLTDFFDWLIHRIKEL
ncbi:MAG: endonuclease NucS domain-containing protein [Candidatus Cryosericum sp.]|nr:endonuclease NucS [bacterium]